MAKKKLTLEELHDARSSVDQNILRVRKILEGYQAELAKINSVENRRRLTPVAIAEDVERLRRKTEMSLGATNASIAQAIRETFGHRDSFSYEHALRTSRFAPAPNPHPGTSEALDRSLQLEVLESIRRSNAEHRAARFTPEDLATEAERAAIEGDVASLSVYRQAARDKRLVGEQKANFDTAFKKLQLPEIDEAQAVFSELELLSQEADSLFTLWREPNNEMAKSAEQLGRFNRRKKAEAIVREAEDRAASEPQQSSAA